MTQTDPSKLIGCVEYAITAIERRYSEWGTNPGTEAELAAIHKCISALNRLMKQERPGRHDRRLFQSVTREARAFLPSGDR